MRRFAASVLCVALGCAAGPGAQGSRPPADAPREPSSGGVASGFPGRDALDNLLAQPLPDDAALASRFREVDRWELAGPFPEAVGATSRRGGGPLDAEIDAFVAERAGLVIATESMDCFAREVGRFLVAEHGLPGNALQHFAAGRCAVATAPPSFGSFSWTTPGRDLDEAGAAAELGKQIAQRLRERVVGGPLELGVWLHAGSGRVDLLVATGERQVRIDPVASVPGPDGKVLLRGELLRPAEWVGAAVTRGRFEWSKCEPGEAAKLPHFELRCPVAADDASAWISLEYRAPDHVLSRVGLTLLVRPQGGDARVFRRTPYAPEHDVSEAAELPAAITEALNAVREDAGLRPLALDPAQTREAERMAPYYFASQLGASSEAIGELVALGMMAGWDVDGVVQDSQFAWALVVETRDVSRLLSDALEYPGARMALLAHEAERIAVGPLLGEGGGEAKSPYLGLIASTYTLFSETTHRRDAEHVQALLAKARAARGRSAPGTLDDALPLAADAAASVQGGAEPRDALERLIESGSRKLGRSVVGWMAETQDLETLVFPDDFLARDELDVAVAVPVRKPEGEAWGRYVVLLLAAEPAHRSL